MSYIDYIGAKEFALYSAKLETKYGERFKIPESLKERIKNAGNGRIFYDN
jgi:3-hydroxyacyl-CoA dehydrogenase/enoyl-CoA hydratase/3-hydroxybutyryl-CoA epimerase